MTDNLTQWYLIRNEIDPKIIGKVNARQSLKMTEGYDYGDQNSVWNIARQDFTDSDFLKTNFEKIELCSGAIYTDLISSMAINSYYVLVISNSFKTFLENVKMPPKFFKQVKVVHPKLNIELNYNTFYMNNQYDIIDFRKSEFIINKTFEPGETGEICRFKDEGELKLFLKEKTWRISIKPVNLILRTEGDFFRIKAFGGYFISEELKKEIEHQNLTGISFEPAENVFVGY